jgi:Flp pilus assembly protein TadG
MALKKKFADFLKCSGGNTAIVFALSIVPMFLAVGASVDMVRANRAQIMMQAAADAAALAAAAEMKDTGTKTMNAMATNLVEEFIAANKLDRSIDTIESVSSDVDPQKGTLTINIKGKMKTTLMKLVGISTMDIHATAEVGFSGAALDIALVLDNTGSMSGKKLSDLKFAASKLVNAVFDQKDNYQTLKIAVVPFSEYVNVGTANAGASWMNGAVTPPASVWEGCVGSRASPDDENLGGAGTYQPVGNVHCVSELLPLSSDKSTIDGKINAMVAEGNTYIPAGLLWGWHALDSAAPLEGGMTKTEMLDKGGRKAIVLMTDGANTISPSYPFHGGNDVPNANALTASLCANAKADDIQLFTVAFEVSDVTIKSILETCASEPSMAFDAANPTALADAFDTIGKKLANLYLSK